MRGETPGPIERPDNSEEGRFENEHEQRYARFMAAQDEAESIIDVLSEVDEHHFPSNVKRRLVGALRELEQVGHEALVPTVSQDRREAIEADSQHRETDAELEDARATIRKNRERAKLERHVELMQAAWDEAYHRAPDWKLIQFTSETRATDVVQQYLTEHQATLGPEDVFFLQTTIELRKAKDALAAAKEERA